MKAIPRQVTIFLVLIVVFTVLILPSVSLAASSSYTSKSINELKAEQERLKKLADEKKAAAAEEANVAQQAQAKIKSLETNISVAQSQISATESTITDTESNIGSLGQQINDRETSIQQKKDYIEKTLRKYFKVQVIREHAGYISIAFSKEGISQKIKELESYSAMKRELARQQGELVVEKEGLQQDKTALEEKKIALEGYKTQKEIQKQDLSEQEYQQALLKEDAQAAYAKLKTEEKSLISEEARIEAVIVQKIQEQIRSRSGGFAREVSGQGTPVSQGQVIGHLGSTGFSTGPHVHFSVFTPEGATVNPRTRLGSQYIWPVGDYRISQEYGPAGWRNPVYTFHNGIDLAGPAGQPVYAAANGKIVLDEYYGGYGNAVVIEHDDGWLTLYGHMTGN